MTQHHCFLFSLTSGDEVVRGARRLRRDVDKREQSYRKASALLLLLLQTGPQACSGSVDVFNWLWCLVACGGTDKNVPGKAALRSEEGCCFQSSQDTNWKEGKNFAVTLTSTLNAPSILSNSHKKEFSALSCYVFAWIQ